MGTLSLPLLGVPTLRLTALTPQQSVLPVVDSFEALCFAHTVSCPVTSSELKSLDRRDLEARVQQLLFQTPFGWCGSPWLHPDFTLENTVQYLPLIIYSS